MDLSTSICEGVGQLKKYLEGIVANTMAPRTVLLLPSADGLTTNIPGFVAFFKQFKGSDITYCLSR